MRCYTGPIIDAHHHFWEPEKNGQPWLRPGVDIGFRYGPYESIKRDYLPPDLLKDAGDLRIVGSVTMETEWRLDDPVGEMRYMQQLQDRFGLPDASVAHAVLKDPKVETVLEQLAEMPIVRAVRNKPGQSTCPWEKSPQDTLLTNDEWIRGFALLEKYDLPFELQVAWWHMEDALELFARYDNIPVYINHAGLPSDRSSRALEGWYSAMSKIADLPQVAVKISGIGIPGVPWTVDNNRTVVESLFELFGADRIMFASNFPVDSLCGSYEDIFHGFLEISENWSATEQKKAFFDNAIKFYRLPQEVFERVSVPQASRGLSQDLN